MTKQLLITCCLVTLIGGVPITFFSSIAVAKNDDAAQKHEPQNDDTTPDSSKRQSDEQQAHRAAITAKQDARFNANQLRACNKSQDAIKDQMQIISDRGVRQLAVFKKIADRTKEFYATNHYNANGYDVLAADVDAAYDNATVSLGATQGAQRDWSCDAADPRSALQTFRNAKQSEIAALNAYRDKVRELILFVKQAGGAQ